MIDGRRVPRHEDLTGRRFGRWTVVKVVPKDHKKYNKHALYFCRCDCGTERIVAAIHLRSGNSQSCDCLRVERVSKRPFESLYNRLVRRNKNVTLSYEAFCTFTEHKNCHYCKTSIRWRVSGYNLDRKNNNLGYSLDNCVVCCGDCNRTKGDRYTYEEFMLLSPILRRIQKQRAAAGQAQPTTEEKAI